MAVFGLVSAVAGFVKVRYLVDKAVIDNMIFRCHYRITSALLFACCIIVTANNLIGDPINCIADAGVPADVINTFCWITYTFSLPHSPNKRIGEHVVYPGVDNYVPGEDEVRYHSYYQWVPFMLFFQGILFYIPHWLWKNWEEGRIRNITDGMRGAIVNCDERKDRQSRLVRYFVDSLHMHNVYAAGYFICEILNFVNVVANIFFVDTFLGGAFLKYGTEVLHFSNMDQENRVDPMVTVFPRLTKCTFHKYGASGTVQRHDALCVLALNILNEKIYIFLWFWFIILAVMSGLALLYSMAVVAMSSFRETVLKRRFRSVAPAGIAALISKIQVGDFLLLHLLGQNMNMMVFGEILDELGRKLHLENNVPPSTLEMSPIYPDKFGKESES